MEKRFIERYFVNNEKKIVVCKLENCENSLNCDMNHKGWEVRDDFKIPDSFIGKAKCSSEDVFDVEIGKKIAYKRAIAKLSTAKKKTLEKLIVKYQKIVDILKEDASELISHYERLIDIQNNN